MRSMEWLMCWFKPSHWRDQHPFKTDEQAEAKLVDAPDRQVQAQHGLGPESHDRADDVPRE